MYLRKLQIPIKVHAYIQSLVIKNTVEKISFERRRGLDVELNVEESLKKARFNIIMGAEKHKNPIPPFKSKIEDEDIVNIKFIEPQDEDKRTANEMARNKDKETKQSEIDSLMSELEKN